MPVQTDPTPPAPKRKTPDVHPAQRPRDVTDDLLVFNLRITERSGVTAPLTLAVPAPESGTAPWQLVHLAAYLGELHRAGEDPTNTTAFQFLNDRAPRSGYPYQALHDKRVTCQMDVLLGPLDGTGWPAVSLVVLESEEGPYGFARKRRRVGAAAVAKLAHLEIAGEHSRLCSRAARAQDASATELRDRAAKLMEEAAELKQQAQSATHSAGARQARAALHTPTSPEPGTSTVVELDPVPERLETLTGRILEVGSRPGADGEVATRMLFAPDRSGALSTSGHQIPERLICTVLGEGAGAAAQLPVGRRVIVVGRLVEQTYVPREQQLPRSLITFNVHALGPDLMSPSLT